MCCISNLRYIVAVVPIAVLLTLSFFVLFALRKVEEKGLKTFGYVVVSIIWLATLVVFSGAIYKTAKSFTMMKCMYAKKMMMSGYMQPREQKVNMPMMGGSAAPVKDKKISPMQKCGGNKGIIFRGEQK